MKKSLALFMMIVMLTLAFTACAKNDLENSKSQTETTEANDKENEEVVEPDQPSEDAVTDMNEFQKLVDTFENGETEEEKEAARQELEKILEQMDSQAQ